MVAKFADVKVAFTVEREIVGPIELTWLVPL